MSPRPIVLCALVLGACVHSPPRKEADPSTWLRRPSKAPGCAFELFEEREPPRPYGVLGVVPLRTNEWVGTQGRKQMLADAACKAGADAVLLPRPTERLLVNERVRDYEALLVTYTDVPAPQEEEAEAPPPPVEDGVLVLPVGPDWPGETVGTQQRTVQPGEGTR